MILEGLNLSKSYGDFKVLQDVSIHCKPGEVCGLVGANGAGKTTLFKILLGLITPDSGTVHIEKTGNKTIGGIIEKPALYEYLNAYDNLKVFCRIQGIRPDQAFMEECLERVGLPLDRKDAVKNFSLGMKQRLGIAIALLNDPKCLILDEPFSGLDPMGTERLRDLILGLAREHGLAIIISSHILDELSRTCQRLYVISKGKIVKEGMSNELIAKHTEHFKLCGEGLDSSVTLKNYSVQFIGNCVRVKIDYSGIPELLKGLSSENIKIHSCIPELDMVKLFDFAPQ
ncbi:ABC transporter ATP-binding protein [Robertkochia solimangrovi]|uniref:ABC transporter ATP-binding protein n=1 Tax=Robertkochia solimangrovi TaxID=2213046 RepID=UPI00118084E3|nr:ABC transporter ATP-binding protein [Robertkochia solimangrovi]TRZ41819.1 ABC transporter ATP-binding protein [Robertkochia solimangrovi]